ncbi:MAG: FixH family protein [Nevskiales bacterium]
MPRYFPLLILLLCACFVITACSKKSDEPPSDEELQMPPAEPRPPSVRPSIKWLPESPRYQSVRREIFREGTDFRSQLDLGTTRLSRHERYRVTIRQRPEPALNELQGWLLHVETADGKPVSGARLNVSGGMPQHGHGMPTQPKIKAEAGAGDYRVEGLQFSMPGWWEVHVYVAQARHEDTATFNLILD